MIDLAILERKLSQAGEAPIAVTPAAMKQILAELEAGRRLAERHGQTFGLGKGVTL